MTSICRSHSSGPQASICAARASHLHVSSDLIHAQPSMRLSRQPTKHSTSAPLGPGTSIS